MGKCEPILKNRRALHPRGRVEQQLQVAARALGGVDNLATPRGMPTAGTFAAAFVLYLLAVALSHPANDASPSGESWDLLLA